MSRTYDMALAALDVGQQQSLETGYGHDTGQCCRCQAVEVSDGDLCLGCRAFLLGDTDTDQELDLIADRGEDAVVIGPCPMRSVIAEVGPDPIIGQSFTVPHYRGGRLPLAVHLEARASGLRALRAAGWSGLYAHRVSCKPNGNNATDYTFTTIPVRLR